MWTTTPWTLYSNFCIVVGPDMDYNLVEQDGKKYWIAASRTAAYFKNPNIVDTCKGSELVGIRYKQLIPWFKPDGDAFRVIPGDYVTTEDGTGIVHIAPTFGADDSKVARLAGVPGLFVRSNLCRLVGFRTQSGRR